MSVALAQPLQPGALSNLEAFTRVLGYVYYFHPSDAVAELPWQEWTGLAARNMERVEAAGSPEELAGLLTEIFRPFAPSVEIIPTGASSAAREPAPEGSSRVFFWVHVPPDNAKDIEVQGDTVGNVFHRGSRINVPVDDGRIPTWIPAREVRSVLREARDARIQVPHPDHPYMIDLPGGITVSIPLALYGDDAGALPRSQTLEDYGLPQGQGPPGGSRSVRLATVMRFWNVMQHFFPYWDVIDADWNHALRVALQDAAMDSNGSEFLVTLQHLAAHLKDGHSVTYNPSLGFDGAFQVPFTADLIEGQRVVVTVVEGNELSNEPGDVITEIDGLPALQALAQMQARVSGVGQWGRYRALGFLLGTEQPSVMSLEFVPYSGGEPFKIQVPTARHDLSHLREYRPPPVEQLAPGILYVDLTRPEVSGFPLLLQELQEAKGIIFDMRGYPKAVGFRLLDHLSLESLWLQPVYVPVITRPDHIATQLENVARQWSKPVPAEEQLTDNIAFIINGNGAISQAESILGIVAGHELGELVGEPTAGANGTSIQLQLPDRYWTFWTGDVVKKFDGSPLFAVGITPTIPAERTINGVAARRDELLEKALEIVSGSLGW
jgi:C-terminal processing protease CtpA/Prc